MSFKAPVFTNKGKQLYASCLAGKNEIIFTNIKLGDGELMAQAIADLEDLVNPIKTIVLNDKKLIGNDQVLIRAVFKNIDISSGFYWREVGLYAQDPENPQDRSKDILFCYQNAGDTAEYIPSASSGLIDKILSMSLVVSDVNSVNVSFFSESYALKEDLEDHKTDPNAHKDLLNNFAKSVNTYGVLKNNNIELPLVRNSIADDSQKYSSVFGGEAYGKGAGLFAYGAKHAEYPGYFDLYAMTSEGEKAELVGTPAGSLTWRRKNLVRSVNGVNADANGNVSVEYVTEAGNGVPVGSVFYFASGSAPSGYLVCNGGAVSRTTYANLFKIIGTKFGSGNGSTTFNVPNLIDKFIQGNSTVGTTKSAGLPNITGSMGIGDMSGISYVLATGTDETGSLRRKGNTTTVSYATSTLKNGTNGYGASINASYSSSIYGNSSTVQPPALTLLPCIKY